MRVPLKAPLAGRLLFAHVKAMSAASLTETVDEIAADEANHRGSMAVHEDTLALVLMAMGDALIGKALARSLGLSDTAARDRAQQMLERALEGVG